MYVIKCYRINGVQEEKGKEITLVGHHTVPESLHICIGTCTLLNTLSGETWIQKEVCLATKPSCFSQTMLLLPVSCSLMGKEKLWSSDNSKSC